MYNNTAIWHSCKAVVIGAHSESSVAHEALAGEVKGRNLYHPE